MFLVRIVGVLDEATPLAEQPPPTQTAVAARRAAYPVTGSALLNGGACCAGGVSGDTIEPIGTFEASSPAGQVTEMRAEAQQEQFIAIPPRTIFYH